MNMHKTSFGKLDKYNVFSEQHTDVYGFSMGHPLRGYDIVPDAEHGGYRGIARRLLQPQGGNITWLRANSVLSVFLFRGSIMSIRVDFTS